REASASLSRFCLMVPGSRYPFAYRFWSFWPAASAPSRLPSRLLAKVSPFPGESLSNRLLENQLGTRANSPQSSRVGYPRAMAMALLQSLGIPPQQHPHLPLHLTIRAAPI